MATPVTTSTANDPDSPPPRRRDLRWDLLAVLAGVLLVLAAAIEGRRLIAAGVDIFLGFPPLLASWAPHIGAGTAPAIAVAAAVVGWGPRLADRLRWRTLLLVGWVTSAFWTVALALIDGWTGGIVGRLSSDQEYLHDVPRVTDLPATLREFTSHLYVNDPTPWATHVAGHPPGALVLFVWLDRLGLGGGGPAGLLVIAVGSSAAVAVAVTLGSLGAQDTARRMLPFGVLTPGAVWVGVSADGLYAGVLAWGIALLAIAATHPDSRRANTAALAAGVLLGYTLYLSYGLVLAGLVVAAVLVATRTPRPIPLVGLGGLAVAAVFTAYGFWWPRGFELLRVLYAASIAKTRPYEYFLWANLAALMFVLGPAVLAGLRRLCRHPRALPAPALLLTGAGLAAILIADITGLSKGEVERIWLPFAIWLITSTALLPTSQRRAWLSAQALLALLVNHLLLTVW